jgi:hypothetical protein
MNDSFPPNSQKAKAEQPREKIQPITSAETRGRKSGLGRRFKATFIEGSAKDAFQFAVEDVVVPAIRDTLHDALRDGLERLIYGQSRTQTRSSSNVPWASAPSNMGRVDYRSMAQPATKQQGRQMSRQARARHDFRDLIIPNPQDANEVLDRMFDLISRTGTVYVADLYELTGIEPSHVDMKWGWRNLRGARAVRTRTGGYLLDLPDPEPVG